MLVTGCAADCYYAFKVLYDKFGMRGDIKREIYRALEDVVGPEDISEGPVILDSYAWRSGMDKGTELFAPRFEAVTLPRDTA